MTSPTTLQLPARDGERGFSMIELLVVLIIMGILAGSVISTMGGTKSTAVRQEAIVSAHSLQKSVESFRRDREGRVPSNSRDWPNAVAGPIDEDAARPYMRARASEKVNVRVWRSVRNGPRTPIAPSPQAGNAVRLQIDYVAIVPHNGFNAIGTTYRIEVSDKGTLVCVLTNDPTTGAGKAC